MIEHLTYRLGFFTVTLKKINIRKNILNFPKSQLIINFLTL